MQDAGANGRLALRTCLLPHRDRPYILSVELARHRIAVFLAQAETWQMHLSAEHPSMMQLEHARQIFTRAMVTRDDRQADSSGRESLALAIEASELLALAHAEVLLHRRFADRPASRAAFGTSIWPERDGAALRDFVNQQFDLIRIPMEWGLLCPRAGVYDWSDCDRWMEWAVEHNRMIIAGPLINFAPGRMPGWLDPVRDDFGKFCDLAYDHMQMVVQRYGDNIGMYMVASGMNTCLDYHFTIKQMIDLIRTLALVVRQGHRARRVMVELSQLWGEYLADETDAMAPITFIEQVLQAGIRLDAVGVQLLMGGPGQMTRDLLEISRQIDRFLHLEPKIIISDLGVPDAPSDEESGYWHSPWTPERQGHWGGQVLPLLLSKPFVESVVWADLYDHPDTQPPGAGLLAADGKPKPVLKRLATLRQRLTRPLGRLERPARADA
jgi:hypothetical protein